MQCQTISSRFFRVTGAVGAALLFSLPAAATLNSIRAETGQIAVSVDGVGTLAPSGTVDVEKPAGGTVRYAYLSCATFANLGIPGGGIPDGSLRLDANPIDWDSIVTNDGVGLPGFFGNHLADVTAIVKPKVDAAPAGLVSFTIEEPGGVAFVDPRTNSPVTFNQVIDGCLLAVILDDPGAPTNNTAVFLFGGQEVEGDSFFVNLFSPIDLSDPSLVLEMGLAISFGAQEGGAAGSHLCGVLQPQDSQIDVNGMRLTSCAGHSDDGVGLTQNGLLFTVGGVGDNTANPSDPFQRAADGRLPRVHEDERYNLVPLVSDGDTVITVNTVNPSNDDNIFFAWFFAPPAEVLPEDCSNNIDDDGDGDVDLDDVDCQFCGNGVAEDPNRDGISEQCDDGNQDAGDGCSDTCQIENEQCVALCADTNESTDSGVCTGDASVDDGSFDPDGDAILLTQNPAGPYSLGMTSVMLSCSDGSGLPADSCTATVTVVDEEAPVALCNAPATIDPTDGLDEDEAAAMSASFTATASDNCGATVEIVEYDCFSLTKKGKRIDKTASCVVSVSGDTVTIDDSGGVGDHITWTAVAVDESGNTSSTACEVIVENPQAM